MAYLAILGSILVLTGWMLNVSELKNILPGETDVHPNCAIGFILSAIALMLLTGPKTPTSTFLLWLVSAVIFTGGALSFLEDITGRNTGIDNIFLPFVHPDLRSNSLRIATGSALCFVFLGPALILVGGSSKRGHVVGQVILNLVSVGASLGIFGYLYRAPSLYQHPALHPMALRTAISLLTISVSASLLHPQLGLTGLLTGPSLGNIMARKLLPTTLVAVFLIGYMRLLTMRFGLISDQLGVVFVFISIFLFTLFIIWNTATELNRIDDQRKLAKDEVDKLNINLARANEGLQAAMQKLEANNQYLEQLAYISSHDIKSPILTLKGLVDLIEKEKGVQAEYAEMFTMISNTVNQMQRTNNSLNNILKLRKNLMAHEVRTEESYSLQTIIGDVKATLQPEIEAAGASVDVQLGSLSDIVFPYVHLKSVFYNLLSNAIKYRDKNRPLQVRLTGKQTGQNVFEFYLEDNGLGIDLDRNRDKLFGIFKRFHDHTEGSGIGLHMVKSIVEAYGGTIDLVSEPGKGTRFTIIWNNLILAQ